MKFTISAEILSNYVNIVSKIVTNKSNLPILNNLKIEADDDKITITGTNLETQISATFKTPVEEPGKTSINAKLFSQYLNSLPKDDIVTVQLKESTLSLTSKRSSASFSVRDPSDFPVFDEEKYSKLFEIEPDTFSKMITKVSFACAKDEIRPILTGVLFEIEKDNLTMVGLDTYRLSKISKKITGNGVESKSFVANLVSLVNTSRIIKDQFIDTVIEDQNVEILLSEAENFITINYGPISIKSRLLDGTYPEYKKIIPSDYNIEFTASVASFLESLRRVAVFAQNAIGQKVFWSITKNQLILEASVPEIGKVTEELDIEVSKFETESKNDTDSSDTNAKSKPFKIAFQLKFLLDILNNIDDEKFVFKGIDSSSPATFNDPSDATFIHLLMPLRID